MSRICTAVAGAPRSLTFVAQGSQVFGLDLGQQAVLEDRRDAPVNDVLAHGTGPVGQSCIGQPRLHRRAEGLDGNHSAFLALLFQRGRDALENGFPRAQEQFARHRQRDAAGAVAAEGQRLAASVEAVVVRKVTVPLGDTVTYIPSRQKPYKS